MPRHIQLHPVTNNQERVDYLKMILEMDSKRLGLIDSQRNSTLAQALIIFPAAFGATLKFLPDANPCLIVVSLLSLAACFFLRDCQLHRYEHGWNGTINEHLDKLSFILANPNTVVAFYTYYKAEEREAFRCREWLSFNRWVYYMLILGAFGAGVILAKGWMRAV